MEAGKIYICHPVFHTGYRKQSLALIAFINEYKFAFNAIGYPASEEPNATNQHLSSKYP
jgi:hypothetical protein